MDMFVMLINLMYRVGFVIMLALLFSGIPVFKAIFSKEEQRFQDKIFMGIFFGLLSIVGTYTGISVHGAISNTRVIGVAVGGLLGGPWVGILAGLLGGGHRFLIDIGGFTALSCGLSTFFEGIIAGLFSKKFKEREDKILYSLLIGAVIELFQMVFIVLTAKPFERAWDLVKVVGAPMIINNAIGIGLFIMIIQNIRRIASVEATEQAKTSLLLADNILKHLSLGFNEKSADKIAAIIYQSTEFKAVAITNKSHILTHMGVGADHHRIHEKCKTKITQQVLSTGKMAIAPNKEDIGCDHPGCKLKTAIVIPLNDGKEVLGALKLYKTQGHMSDKEIELAKGLSNIFSSQLTLKRLEEQSVANMKIEMNALQAQINPHFLFNAINTIVALIRKSPEEARRLLLHLSDYFRMNMQNNVDRISIEEEINHIDAYLEIEKARFGEKLRVTWDVSCNQGFLIPPLTIQPLVENAVKHGITKKAGGGRVHIGIEEREDKIHIQISDDGVGMSEKRFWAVKAFSDDTGIGLANVYKRLKTLYGEALVFDIESLPEKGTIIDIFIPKEAKGC